MNSLLGHRPFRLIGELILAGFVFLMFVLIRDGSGTKTITVTDLTAAEQSSIGSLEELQSYRYSVSFYLGGIELPRLDGLDSSLATPSALRLKAEGVHVAPDRGSLNLTVNGITITQTTIGNQQWTVRDGVLSGPQTITPTLNSYTMVGALWDNNISGIVRELGCSPTGTEFVNGLLAERCVGAPADEYVKGIVDSLAMPLGGPIANIETFFVEAWLAEPNKAPVRFRSVFLGVAADGTPVNILISFDLVDINHPQNQVVAPQ